jgi:uncharacterized protein (TIGR01777 family)
LIGAALIPTLEARGYSVTRLVRTREPRDGPLAWDPTQPLRPESVSGFDVVIHLAGEPVATRWTEEKKKRILDSRVLGTAHLSEALAKTAHPPRVLISGSAIGYYGDRGEEVLREDSPSGTGFLPEVCRQWEAATKPAANAGIRTIQIRTGIVLSAQGGALKKMLLPFRLGLGAQIGNGRQWMSWIHIEDLVGAIHLALDSNSVAGPVNLVAPEPVRNSEFTKTLAGVLSRPAIFRIPAFAVRLVFGEMAEEVLLADQRVEPAKLVARGYQFKYRNLRNALESILRKIPVNRGGYRRIATRCCC